MQLYDNFFLPADDLEKGRAFYQDMLGLRVKFDLSAQGILAFNVGKEEPALFLGKAWNKPAIWFEVDDVQAMYGAMKEKGVDFLSEPFEVRTGFAVEFDDPFGNRLGIADYTKMPELSRARKQA
jgi:predicted enzyme related to lactoylglutathione lyase